MAKARKARRLSTPGRGRARSFAAVPLSGLTAAEERLALKFDALVTDADVKDRQIKAMQPGIMAAKVRGGSMSVGKAFTDFGHLAGVKWPDTLYIPRDQQASSHPKPPDSRLYSHAWTGGNGVATASRDSGGLFAYAAASTIDAVKSSDAAVGITYAPASRLSYVRFEPDIYCSMAYRMFVDFWPQLVAGQVRVGSSVITGQWRRDPVAGSYELLRWNEVPVFDSLDQDAGSNVFPNIRHTLQRNFVNAALGTTFLVEGGRTYVFGVAARAWVRHNVTSNTGKPIPQDATRFRLYSEMVCSVPFMALSVQTVLVP